MLHAGGLAALVGVRQARRSPWHRRIVTGSMRAMNRLLFGVSLDDANVPYKLIRKSAWDGIRGYIHPDCQVPSVCVAIALMHRDPSVVRQVPVSHTPRRAGQTTLKLGRLGKLCARATMDLLHLRRRLRRSG